MQQIFFEHRYPVGKAKPPYERIRQRALADFKAAGGEWPSKGKLRASPDKVERMVVVQGYRGG